MYGKSMMKKGGSPKMKKYGMGGPKDELAPLKPNTPKSTTPTGGSSKQTGAPVPVDRIKRKGGPIKKYGEGGKTGSSAANAAYKGVDAVGGKKYQATVNAKKEGTIETLKKTDPIPAWKKDVTDKEVSKYKTGGMVNSNAKVSALKSAGSKGVKSGTNPKATASKKAKGRSGGTSKAPRRANP